ncbi:hypothetical protein [Nonomuraea polychroma]|nr:hypothetical protein [Nonomuraea polychroma]
MRHSLRLVQLQPVLGGRVTIAAGSRGPALIKPTCSARTRL